MSGAAALQGAGKGPAGWSDRMLPRPYRVLAVRSETPDIFTLELEPGGGADGFAFAAGQFNMLYVFGVGEAPLSISGDPVRPRPLLHTVRAVGPVTQALERLAPGAVVGLRGPFGNRWPVAEAASSDVLLAAGGIGLAPLRPALYQLLAQRDLYGRVVLLYGARTPRDLLYERELHEWRGHFDLEVQVTVDSAAGGWRGQVGVVPALIGQVRPDPGHTVALVCGPEVMMRFTVLELERQGVPPANVFLSLERNFKCAVGFCGHCQFGPTFVCKDGPVFRYDRIRPFFETREV